MSITAGFDRTNVDRSVADESQRSTFVEAYANVFNLPFFLSPADACIRAYVERLILMRSAKVCLSSRGRVSEGFFEECMKLCPGCQLAKPLSAYHRNRTKPDLRASDCKRCANANMQRKRNAKRRQALVSDDQPKTCRGVSADAFTQKIICKEYGSTSSSCADASPPKRQMLQAEATSAGVLFSEIRYPQHQDLLWKPSGSYTPYNTSTKGAVPGIVPAYSSRRFFEHSGVCAADYLKQKSACSAVADLTNYGNVNTPRIATAPAGFGKHPGQQGVKLTTSFQHFPNFDSAANVSVSCPLVSPIVTAASTATTPTTTSAEKNMPPACQHLEQAGCRLEAAEAAARNCVGNWTQQVASAGIAAQVSVGAAACSAVATQQLFMAINHLASVSRRRYARQQIEISKPCFPIQGPSIRPSAFTAWSAANKATKCTTPALAITSQAASVQGQCTAQAPLKATSMCTTPTRAQYTRAPRVEAPILSGATSPSGLLSLLSLELLTRPDCPPVLHC